MSEVTPKEKRALEKLAKVLDDGDVALSEHLLEIEDEISEVKDEILSAIADKEVTEIPEPQEFPTQMEISNLPEIQKVEVTNFPTYPEQKAPVFNYTAPEIHQGDTNVTVDTKEVADEIAKITAILNKPESEEIEQTQILDEDGKVVDFKQLFRSLNERIANIRTGGGSSLTVPQNLSVTNLGINVLSGTSTNGTRDLTVANTWYAVPSTVPTQPYILVATVENSVGTVRFGFDGTGTPSATNGNQAPSQLTVRLDANQVVYYASSTAGDDVNWTAKVI
jgi:hypothetical protein